MPSRRLRSSALVVVTVLLAVAAVLVVLDDFGARDASAAARATLSSSTARLSQLRTELARAERRLDGARRAERAVVGEFDADEAALSSAQATLVRDEAGIHRGGVDVGQLDRCLDDVEQAVNQMAVGQNAGGLASLQASSSACAVLDEVEQ